MLSVELMASFWQPLCRNKHRLFSGRLSPERDSASICICVAGKALLIDVDQVSPSCSMSKIYSLEDRAYIWHHFLLLITAKQS